MTEVESINKAFRTGKPAWEIKDPIREFPRPITVDFNNVIANNKGSPLLLNPDTPRFIEELRQIGNVFIVTTASSWDAVHEFFTENNIWSEDLILMVMPNWAFLTTDRFGWEDDPVAKTAEAEFLELARSLDWVIEGESVLRPSGFKRVAPIFGKKFLVPIIDNRHEVTTNNPGMLGVPVKEWEPRTDKSMLQYLERYNTNRLTLHEAAEVVRKHYLNLE